MPKSSLMRRHSVHFSPLRYPDRVCAFANCSQIMQRNAGSFPQFPENVRVSGVRRSRTHRMLTVPRSSVEVIDFQALAPRAGLEPATLRLTG